MRTRFIVSVATLAMVGTAIAYMAADRAGTASAQGARAAPSKSQQVSGVPVETAIAERSRTRTDIQAIGSLQSDEAVRLAPEIAGRIAHIDFIEGKPVKEGDVLVRLDDALAQAEVADAQARHDLARQNYDRAIALARTGTGTERARDEATAALATARVALELARVRLDKHSIRAPFSGTVGIRRISVGAFLNVGTELVNIEKIDSLKVDFKVPEIFLAAIREGQEIEVTVDALPGTRFAGSIYAIDPLVDVNGRAVQIRALLPNKDLLLRPGLFARVTIRGAGEEDVVRVPESAVVPRGGETFVFRIDAGKAVESKVQLGQRRAGFVDIVEGLKAGETVVVAGHQRLRNGASVDVVAAAPGVKG